MAKEATAVKDEPQDAQTESAPVTTPDDGANAQVAEEKDLMEATLDELESESEETEGEAADADDTAGDTEPVETDTQPQGEKPEEPSEEKLAPKSENRFQKLANENKELKAQLDRLKLQETQLASEQELLNEVNPETGDYYTPQEIERLAFAQSREQQAQKVAQERYELEVQQNQELIANESTKALEDFPIFNDKSPDFNPGLSAQLNQLIDQTLIRDPNTPEIGPDGQPTGKGRIIGANLSPYQLAKTIADATTANSAKIQAEAQKATEKMLANADVPSGASNATKTKVDPDLAAFDEEAGL